MMCNGSQEEASGDPSIQKKNGLKKKMNAAKDHAPSGVVTLL